MATLTVWCYGTPLGAAAGELMLRRLCVRRHLPVIDAVSVSWLPGAHRPRVIHAPGPEEAAPGGATTVDPAFVDEVMTRLLPGTSELWVLAEEPDVVSGPVERVLARGDVAVSLAEVPCERAEELRAMIGELVAVAGAGR